MDHLTEVLVHSKLVFEVNGEVVTDSLVIAKTFGRDHYKVLEDIRKNIVYAGEEFGQENFYESIYTNSQDKRMSKYNLTEEAFVLLAMGYNTREAVRMKIKFIEEFKRMNRHIQNQQKIPKDPIGVLKLTFAALEGHAQEIQEIKSEVRGLRENAPLYAIECDEITRAVKRLGVMLLGGKNSNSYQDISLRRKVYRDIYSQLHREFGVNSYKAIKRNQLEGAIQIINEDYSIPTVLEEEITVKNLQLHMVEVQ